MRVRWSRTLEKRCLPSTGKGVEHAFGRGVECPVVQENQQPRRSTGLATACKPMWFAGFDSYSFHEGLVRAAGYGSLRRLSWQSDRCPGSYDNGTSQRKKVSSRKTRCGIVVLAAAVCNDHAGCARMRVRLRGGRKNRGHRNDGDRSRRNGYDRRIGHGLQHAKPRQSANRRQRTLFAASNVRKQ